MRSRKATTSKKERARKKKRGGGKEGGGEERHRGDLARIRSAKIDRHLFPEANPAVRQIRGPRKIALQASGDVLKAKHSQARLLRPTQYPHHRNPPLPPPPLSRTPQRVQKKLHVAPNAPSSGVIGQNFPTGTT